MGVGDQSPSQSTLKRSFVDLTLEEEPPDDPRPASIKKPKPSPAPKLLDDNAFLIKGEEEGKDEEDEDSADEEVGEPDEGWVHLPMPPGCTRRACKNTVELAARRRLWYEEEVAKLAEMGKVVCEPPKLCPDGMSLHWHVRPNVPREDEGPEDDPSEEEGSTDSESASDMEISENELGSGSRVAMPSADVGVPPINSSITCSNPCPDRRHYSPSVPEGPTAPPIAVLQEGAESGNDTDVNSETEDGEDDEIETQSKSSDFSMAEEASVGQNIKQEGQGCSEIVDLTLNSDDSSEESQSSSSESSDEGDEREIVDEHESTEDSDEASASESSSKSSEKQETLQTLPLRGTVEAKEASKLFAVRAKLHVVRFMKDGKKHGRRIFRMGEDLVIVSHVGELDRISLPDRRWLPRAKFEVDQDRNYRYVFDPAPLDDKKVVIPFDFTRIPRRFRTECDTSKTPRNIGIFRWKARQEKPTSYFPDRQPHDRRGVSSITTKDGKLYTGGHDGSLALWNFVQDGERPTFTRLQRPHTSAVRAMVCSSAKNWLYSAGHMDRKLPERMAIVDLVKDQVVRRVTAAHPICQMQEHPDQPDIILCESKSIENQFLLLDFRVPKQSPVVAKFGDTVEEPPVWIKGALWADWFAKGIGNHTIRVWDIRNATRHQDIVLHKSRTHPMVPHLLMDAKGITALRNNEVIFIDWTLQPPEQR